MTSYLFYARTGEAMYLHIVVGTFAFLEEPESAVLHDVSHAVDSITVELWRLDKRR